MRDLAESILLVLVMPDPGRDTSRARLGQRALGLLSVVLGTVVGLSTVGAVAFGYPGNPGRYSKPGDRTVAGR